jgi:type I restriction enzyme S subunit
MPEEFLEKKLKNLIDIRSGYTWGKEQESSNPVEGSVRVLTVSNIQQELDLSSELYLMNVSEKEKLEKKAERGWSIAVGSNGNRKRIGNAVYINNDDEYLFASFLVGFKPKPESGLHPRYFYQWLTSYPVQERITVVSEGTTGLGNLNIRHFRNMGIQYPKKYSEQEAIVKIFETLDEALKATQKSIAQAQQLKRALMQHLLSGRLKPDGTWRKPDEFYVDEKFGRVPKGWNVKTSNDIFFINKDTLSAKTPDDYEFNYITIEAVSTEEIQWEAITRCVFKDAPSRARRVLSSGDILLSTVRPNLKSFAIFQAPNNEKWICSTGFSVFTPKPNQDRDFYFYQILGEIGEKQFYSYVAGTNYPAVNDRDMRKLKLLEAPYPEQIEISKKLTHISQSISMKKNKIKILQTLRKSLMQNLLTGKIRVQVG